MDLRRWRVAAAQLAPMLLATTLAAGCQQAGLGGAFPGQQDALRGRHSIAAAAVPADATLRLAPGRIALVPSVQITEALADSDAVARDLAQNSGSRSTATRTERYAQLVDQDVRAHIAGAIGQLRLATGRQFELINEPFSAWQPLEQARQGNFAHVMVLDFQRIHARRAGDEHHVAITLVVLDGALRPQTRITASARGTVPDPPVPMFTEVADAALLQFGDKLRRHLQ